MDDERHLWPALLHLIRERRPERFFGEQVASKDGLGWLDLVQTDMEAEGYAIGALDTCSAGSGAPHIRQRLRIYAYDLRPAAGALGDPAGTGSLSGPQRGLHHREEGRGPWDGQSERSGDAVWLVDGIEPRLEGFGGGFATEGGHREAALRSVAASGELGRLADDRREHGQRWANSEGPVESDSREWWEDTVHSEPRGSVDRLAHSESCGRADGPQIVGSGGQVFGAAGQIVGIGDRCSFDGLADAGRGQFSQPLRRAEGRDGYGSDRSHPRPGPTNGFWRDADWVFCRDEKWRPIRPGSFPLVDGASFRVDSGSPYAGKSRQGMLKAYGNAIDAEATIDFIDACLEHRTIELEAVADVASGSLSLEDLLA
nr:MULTISPECIES: hypothetical protein [unclassified Mesorhizobium]